MGQELTTFADRPALSTKFAKFFEENKNIQDKSTTPSLSIENKNWTVVLNGEKTVLQKRDADGDMVPLTTMKVIVLDQAPTRGRAYYGKTYDPKKAEMPECWSEDSVSPSPHVKESPKNDEGVCVKSCAACPMSVKGSRKSDNGKETTACGQHQMIAVIPANDFTFEPLRMKLPITSVWDGQNKANDEAGWFAFKNYTDYLRAHQVDHTAMLVTKMKFDATPGISYPKVLFARDKFLTDEEIEKLIPIIQGEKVKALVNGSWTPNGRDGVKTAQLSGPADDEAAAAAKDVTPSNAEKAAAIVAAREAKEAEAAAAEVAKKAAAKAKRIAEAQAALAAAAAEDDDPPATPATVAKTAPADDDDGDPVLPGTAAAAPTQAASAAKAGAPKVKATAAAAPAAGKPATAAAAGAAPEGLNDLLSKWGD